MVPRKRCAPPVIAFIVFLPLAASGQSQATAVNLRSLAEEFFAWRAVTQPSTYDDVNRVERPDDWLPDWSPGALRQYEQKQAEFRNRLGALDHSGWSLSDSVNFLLLRSAIARVNYELNVVRSARRNPDFYVQQTLGAVYELLLQPPPFDERRSRNIVLRLEAIPRSGMPPSISQNRSGPLPGLRSQISADPRNNWRWSNAALSLCCMLPTSGDSGRRSGLPHLSSSRTGSGSKPNGRG